MMYQENVLRELRAEEYVQRVVTDALWCEMSPLILQCPVKETAKEGVNLIDIAPVDCDLFFG